MYGAPYKMYGASYILYVAANTCMVRAVLYCTVLRAFSHFHAIYRCFPYNSARNSYFPLHLCAGPVGDSGAQINQPTGARVQIEHCLGTPVIGHDMIHHARESSDGMVTDRFYMCLYQYSTSDFSANRSVTIPSTVLP